MCVNEGAPSDSVHSKSACGDRALTNFNVMENYGKYTGDLLVD